MITARANDLEPYEYLTHIFAALPKAASLDDFESLLPELLPKLFADKGCLSLL
ncbi:transposase domain-containing protein [Oligoflexus sp.]|uniref:transposase domain-containing protein n=1 Tax=Oligoflexus sp. TaxID=1971216 RepID=UPI0039C9D76B